MAKVKKIKTVVKLQVPAGAANPAPPVGPALGQHGLNIMDFCKQFNEKTRKMEQGVPIPAVITIYEDRTFSFVTKMPPMSSLIKKMAGLAKGSGEPNKSKVGKMTVAQVEEVARQKMPDLNTKDISRAVEMVKGTAASMGVEITE